MGYAGKIQLRIGAEKLRKKGFSIKEIEQKLKVSRSSVSLWVRDIKLTKKQIEKLYCNKRTGALKGSYIAAQNKIRAKKELIEKFNAIGASEVGRLSQRDEFIAGIALYFAEGDKSIEHIGFSNSDSRAIAFMVDWFYKYCKIPKNRLHFHLYIHDNLNEEEAKQFWIKLLNIKLDQFRKSYIVKNKNHKLRKSKHINGVLNISVCDVNLHRKMMGWINGIFYSCVPRWRNGSARSCEISQPSKETLK